MSRKSAHAARMHFQLNVEEMEGRWIAHATALQGCYASAPTLAAAVSAAPGAIRDYGLWLRQHGEDQVDGSVETVVDEVHRAWNSQPDYEVNAFFASDRPPLASSDIERALKLLSWTREDLRAATAGLAPEAMGHEFEDEWAISRILNHVARAENWYLSRLDLAEEGALAGDDIWERLRRVRARAVQVLPLMAGDNRVVTLDGELWSPRKLLRRAVWHERDHTAHIALVRQRLLVSPRPGG